MKFAPTGWLVVTPERVLIVHRANAVSLNSKPGQILLSAPRSAIAASHKSGIVHTITLWEAATGKEVVRLNFGMGSGRSQRVMAAFGPMAIPG